MIRHNPVKIARRVRAQIRDVQIDQIRFDVVEDRVDDVDAVHKLAVVEGHDFSRVAELDQLGGVEGVDGREFVDAREHNDGHAVGARGAGDGRGAASGDQAAVREDGVRGEDDFVDA